MIKSRKNGIISADRYFLSIQTCKTSQFYPPKCNHITGERRVDDLGLKHRYNNDVLERYVHNFRVFPTNNNNMSRRKYLNPTVKYE